MEGQSLDERRRKVAPATRRGRRRLLPRGPGMGFTEEQLRACVLDGGTRFVAPGQVTYWEHDGTGLINEVSDERKALTDEDVLRVQSALGDAVEQLDLAGCEQLTDATVIEIVPRCPNLRVAMLGRVYLRRRARALSLSTGSCRLLSRTVVAWTTSNRRS